MARGSSGRLVLVAASTGIGGAERHLADIAAALSESGAALTIVAPATGGVSAFFARHVPLAEVRGCPLVEPGVARQQVGETTTADLRRRPAADWLRRRPRTPATAALVSIARLRTLGQNRHRVRPLLRVPDVACLWINNGGWPGASSAFAAAIEGRRAGISRVVMTVHSTPSPTSFASPLEHRLEQRVAAALDTIVLLGDRPAQAFRSRVRADPARLRIIRPGIPDPPATLERSSARARFGLTDGPTVVSVANFTPYKDHTTLLKAFAIVQQRMPAAQLVLAGAGPGRPGAEAMAAALLPRGAVRFLGHVDPFDAFAAADVAALSSHVEGFPISILEAMSLGVPIVATDVGAVSEAVLDGVTGRVVRAGDAAAFAAALESILADSQLRARLGSASASRSEEFRITRVVKDYRSVLLD